MANRVFSIGRKFVVLDMVVMVEEHPGFSWGDGEDERSPRLQVQMIGNTWLDLMQSDCKAAGFADASDLAAKLIAAIAELSR